MKDEAKLLCRLPPEIKGFLERQSAKFGSSMNSEVVRSIRERMDRMEKEMPATVGKKVDQMVRKHFSDLEMKTATD